MCITLYCLTHKQLKKNIKRSSDPKINQNLALKKKISFLQTQKVSKSNPNSFVTFCPNVNDSFSIPHGSSLEMFRFLTSVHENFCKTFPKFYHNLHAWNHDTMTNFMIFWICFLLIEFYNNSFKQFWVWFVSKIFEIYFCFRLMSSPWTPYHENHFSIHYTPLYKTLPV